MSVKIMSLVWDLDLPAKEKLLLLALADSANDFGANCYPSVATLSRKTSMPERTVQRMIAGLVSRGIVSTHYERGARQKLVRHFRVAIDGVELAPIPDYSNCPKPLREETINAFGHVCAYCQQAGTSEQGPDGKAWHIDRIVPGSRGGKYVPENVTLSCSTCNISKGARLAPHGSVSLGAKLDIQGCHSEQVGCQIEHNNGATDGTLSISRTIKEPSEEPSGLDREAWERFHGYRKEIRKPIKPASMLAAQRKLAGFGADQGAVVEQSIANGWQGLFELKGIGPRVGRQHLPSRTSAELIAEAEARGEDVWAIP